MAGMKVISAQRSGTNDTQACAYFASIFACVSEKLRLSGWSLKFVNG